MDTVSDISELRKKVRAAKLAGAKVSFVPTMGYLHAGHISLVNLAANYGDFIVASLFVNPTQFNDPKDFERYPRDTDRDCELLAKAGVNLVFVPEVSSIYRPEHKSAVTVSNLGDMFEGASRPGHFQGVTTVVSILFHLVEPDFAVFGEKDFQQLRIIEQMVADLKFSVKIVRGPLIRDSDGLALSSRNVRLSPSARISALSLSQGLFRAQEAFRAGEVDGAALCRLVRAAMERAGVAVDYAELINEETLTPVSSAKAESRMLVAATIDGIRLIDNVGLGGANSAVVG